MQKKSFFNLYLLGFFLLLHSSLCQSQNLYVGATSDITVVSGVSIYVGGNIEITNSGSMTLNSDATGSSSLILEGSSLGNITYNRFISTTDWQLLSSPVTGQNINSFAQEANNSVNFNPATGNYAVARYKAINGSSTRWTYHNNAPSAENQETLINFNPGEGYSTNRTSQGFFEFSGGISDADVGFNALVSMGTHTWACVGNPFPSHMPANLSANSQNILSSNIGSLDPSFAALYFWNGSAYTPINNASSGLNIAPGQAFMVNMIDDDETFTFLKALQMHPSSTGAGLFRNNTTNSTEQIELMVSNGSESRTTTFLYLDNATKGLDVGLDAGAFYNDTPSFALDSHLVDQNQGIDFTLQCLPTNSYGSYKVPISLKVAANSVITFTASSENLPDDVDVYIEDTVENTFEKISENPYSVLINENISSSNRFYMHTAQPTLSNDELISQRIKIFTTDSKQLEIYGIDSSIKKADIILYSITGKAVLSHRLDIDMSEYKINLPNALVSGIYIARLTTNLGVKTQKLMIK